MSSPDRQHIMDGVYFTPLKRISTPEGEVRHGLRASEDSFVSYGEVYFSEIFQGMTKGWKRHRIMTMNLIVVKGTIRFIFYDERKDCQLNAAATLSADSREYGPYGRLTISPGIWVAFQGIETANLLLNLASIEHDPSEAETRNLDEMASFLRAGDVVLLAGVG